MIKAKMISIEQKFKNDQKLCQCSHHGKGKFGEMTLSYRAAKNWNTSQCDN